MPRVIVTFVHGTFAGPDDPWLQPNGRFAEHLKDRIPDLYIPERPFCWSGHNSVEARYDAAEKLRDHLRQLLNSFQEAQHFVIAHSHGGSVAWAALADPDLADRVRGVVTLGTPFVTVSGIHHEPPMTFVEAGVATFFSGVTVFAAGALMGRGRTWWPYALSVMVVVACALLMGSRARQAMQRRASQFVRLIPRNTALRCEQVAILRTTADEAAAALFGARVAGGLVWLFWEWLISPVKCGLHWLLESIDYLNFRKLGNEFDEAMAVVATRQTTNEDLFDKPTMNTLNDPARSAHSVLRSIARQTVVERQEPFPHRPSVETPWKTAWSAIRQELPVAIVTLMPSVLALLENSNPWTRLVGFILTVGYGLPALGMLLVSVASVPFGIVLALGRCPCGWTLPLAGHYLDLTVEPGPPGTWSVTHLQARGKGLSHTLAHENHKVWQFTANWIMERVTPRTPRAGASQSLE